MCKTDECEKLIGHVRLYIIVVEVDYERLSSRKSIKFEKKLNCLFYLLHMHCYQMFTLVSVLGRINNISQVENIRFAAVNGI